MRFYHDRGTDVVVIKLSKKERKEMDNFPSKSEWENWHKMKRYLRIISAQQIVAFSLERYAPNSGGKVTISEKVIRNMTASLKNYNDLRNNRERKLALRSGDRTNKWDEKKESIWEDECSWIFWKFWNKYRFYFCELVKQSPGSANKRWSLFLMLELFHIRDVNDLRLLWWPLIREVKRFMLRYEKLEWGTKTGRKQLYEGRKRDMEYLHAQAVKKGIKAIDTVEFIIPRINKKYGHLFPGKRSACPGDDRVNALKYKKRHKD